MSEIILKRILTFIGSMVILSLVLITLICLTDDSPTFRQYCEANNGVYIENHGHAGNSCIYSKGSEE